MPALDLARYARVRDGSESGSVPVLRPADSAGAPRSSDRSVESTYLLSVAQQRILELEGEVEERDLRLISAKADLAALRASVEAVEDAADLETRLRIAEQQLRQRLDHVTELEADLVAAEEHLHRVEAELRVARAASRSAAAEGPAALLPDVEAEADLAADAPLGAAAPARLLVRIDGDSEVIYLLGRRTTIGRDPGNDVQVDAEFISRTHASVLAGPQQTFVEDLGSTNGTLLNGRRVSRAQLNDGDILEIGKSQFRFAHR